MGDSLHPQPSRQGRGRRSSEADWQRTDRILPHGSLAAGFLTGNFDVASVSAAASTGIMDLRTGQWRREMLDALATPEHRELAWKQLPRIVDQYEPVGPLARRRWRRRPASMPTQAPLDLPDLGRSAGRPGRRRRGRCRADGGHPRQLGGGQLLVRPAARDGQPRRDAAELGPVPLDALLQQRLGLDQPRRRRAARGPSWRRRPRTATRCRAARWRCRSMPASRRWASRRKRVGWTPEEPGKSGPRAGPRLEALAYLIALGVDQHEAAGQAGQPDHRLRRHRPNRLMCEILASVLGRPVRLLASDEGPALGAAVTALAALESQRRKQRGDAEAYTVADAVAQMVRFRDTVEPNPAWQDDVCEGAAEVHEGGRHQEADVGQACHQDKSPCGADLRWDNLQLTPIGRAPCLTNKDPCRVEVPAGHGEAILRGLYLSLRPSRRGSCFFDRGQREDHVLLKTVLATVGEGLLNKPVTLHDFLAVRLTDQPFLHGRPASLPAT